VKLPSFQFYPGDWMKDPDLRRCSAAARGIWFDMICLMFECQDRGVLATSGVPWTNQEIAASISGNPADNLSHLEELLSKGVARRNDSGAVYCKRMVQDQQARSSNAERQQELRKRKSRDHEPRNGESNAAVTPVSQCSSSSSSTSKKEEKKERRADKPRDPRLDHPALKAVVEVKGSYPNRDTWDLVIKVVGEIPDVDRLRECWVTWRSRDYAPGNLGWLTDWYINGIQGVRNGSNATNRESSTERNARNLRENVEFIRDLSRGGGTADCEDPIGLLTAGV
jgi:hypothetical protein